MSHPTPSGTSCTLYKHGREDAEPVASLQTGRTIPTTGAKPPTTTTATINAATTTAGGRVRESGAGRGAEKGSL
ncbi:hypothetical protein Sm713_07970 [Streptomyces sp. TS71-3]|nr:hypothetical protein Sm713_07970 [Streptomyces sp. TS71-3]